MVLQCGWRGRGQHTGTQGAEQEAKACFFCTRTQEAPTRCVMWLSVLFIVPESQTISVSQSATLVTSLTSPAARRSSPVMRASARASFRHSGMKTVMSRSPLSQNQSTASRRPWQENTFLSPWLQTHTETDTHFSFRPHINTQNIKKKLQFFCRS